MAFFVNGYYKIPLRYHRKF